VTAEKRVAWLTHDIRVVYRLDYVVCEVSSKTTVYGHGFLDSERGSPNRITRRSYIIEHTQYINTALIRGVLSFRPTHVTQKKKTPYKWIALITSNKLHAGEAEKPHQGAPVVRIRRIGRA